MIWVLFYLGIGCLFTALVAVPHLNETDRSAGNTPDWFVVLATLLGWPVLTVATLALMLRNAWRQVP